MDVFGQDRTQLLKIRLAFGFFMAFLISGCFARDEFRYAIWGARTKATVDDTSTHRFGRNSSPVKVVTLGFNDPATGHRAGQDQVAPDYPIQPGETVAVQYIPGDEYAVRVLGNRNLVPVFFFFGCLVAMAVAVGLLAREANQPVRGRRR
jgi:hypothetical protein